MITRTLRQSAALAAATSCLIALPALPALAGSEPIGDHYKLYTNFSTTVLTCATHVAAFDQFGGPYDFDIRPPKALANPAEKILGPDVSPIRDPRTHYAFYQRATTGANHRVVRIENQFGSATIDVEVDPLYLMVPALETEGGPLPQRNHYVCHFCDGPIIGRVVTIRDRFGDFTAVVQHPSMLCTPASKVHDDGKVFPVVDPNLHLVAYPVNPSDARFFDAGYEDQLTACHGLQPLRLGPLNFLLVPSLKVDPTPSESETWGRVKATYR